MTTSTLKRGRRAARTRRQRVHELADAGWTATAIAADVGYASVSSVYAVLGQLGRTTKDRQPETSSAGIEQSSLFIQRLGVDLGEAAARLAAEREQLAARTREVLAESEAIAAARAALGLDRG
jgi:hypothetical protein